MDKLFLLDKVFMTFGMYLDEGLAKGIEKYASKPVNAVKDMTDEVSGAFGAEYSVNGNRGRTSAGAASAQPIVIQVVLDGKVIGETSYNYMRRHARAVGA